MSQAILNTIKNTSGFTTDYNSVEATINTGTSDASLDFGDLSVGYNFYIANDGTGDISIKINGSTKVVTIKAGEVFKTAASITESILITNTSGVNVDYRFYIEGVIYG